MAGERITLGDKKTFAQIRAAGKAGPYCFDALYGCQDG